jgi:hypothetical protein
MARLAFQPQCSRLPIQLRIRAPGVLGPPSEAGHHIFGLSLQAKGDPHPSSSRPPGYSGCNRREPAACTADLSKIH